MANTYTVYEVVGKKEDVSDIISNISPTDTPFQSMVGKETISNVLFQWQEDTLAAVDSSNAQYDGFDASEIALTPTTIRTNYTQILAKAIKVAATTDKTARYGRAKETAYQLSKKAAELKRDFETILLGAQAGGTGQNAADHVITSIGNTTGGSGGAAVARTLASFQAQVDSTHLHKTGGSSTAMTETLLNTALQTLYTDGGTPRYIMIPPGEAGNIASYASASGRYRTLDQGNDSASRKIINVIDVYVSPFGEVKVILNRFQSNIDHLIFDPEMWKVCVLRPWTREPLAKIGDAERHMIVGEYSLKHKNQKGSSIVRKAA